jgi:hypothetical protein
MPPCTRSIHNLLPCNTWLGCTGSKDVWVVRAVHVQSSSQVHVLSRWGPQVQYQAPRHRDQIPAMQFRDWQGSLVKSGGCRAPEGPLGRTSAWYQLPNVARHPTKYLDIQAIQKAACSPPTPTHTGFAPQQSLSYRSGDKHNVTIF